MPIDFDEIRKQITREVAEGVVAKLPEEAKRAIIAQAMTTVLSSYDFQHIIEAKMKAVADERLCMMLQDTAFDKRLTAKFQEGLDMFMQALPKAVAAAMVGTLLGPTTYKTGAIYEGLRELLELPKEI